MTLILTFELRDSLGLDADQFNEERASGAIDEVNALAVVYAGGQAAVDTMQSDDPDAYEALRQVVKRFAKRVYSNPEGVLQKNVQNVVSTSYADSSRSAHGLDRTLQNAVRMAIRGSSVQTPLYASEDTTS